MTSPARTKPPEPVTEPGTVWRWRYLAEAALILLAAALFIRPLFRAKYLQAWDSIESTFIADARFLSDHWPHPLWQPNWYCGTRTDYIYPPALRYGTAAQVRYIPGMLPVRAYHIYIAFFYAFGIAAGYLFVRVCSRSALAACWATAACALVSPCFVLIPPLRGDSPQLMPQRLNVLLRYGEGPHVSSLGWILFALTFSFLALQRWRPMCVALAAAGCAMAVSNNFYGATSLALLYPILVWSTYVTRPRRDIWVSAVGIPLIAWGLVACWLTPDYVRITLHNMRYVASEGNAWSVWVFAFFVVAFAAVSLRLVRANESATYLTFLCGAAGAFTLIVVGHYYLNFRITGEPHRYYPELDLAIILLSAEIMRRMWSAGGGSRTAVRAGVIVFMILCLVPSWRYVSSPRTVFVTDSSPQDRIQYQIQDWVAANLPGSRILTAGSIRFWFNVWHDIPQLGGGSDQGILNPTVVPPVSEAYFGEDPEPSLLWLQVMGVDAVIVSGPRSADPYKDFRKPDKFRGRMRILADDGADNVVYEVPRRQRSLARVVDRDRHRQLPAPATNYDVPTLRSWYRVVEEDAPVPAETRFDTPEVMRIRTTVQPGQAVWVQESYDPNWHAFIGHQELTVRKDNLGFMAVDAPPGRHDIRLVFQTPAANTAGRLITGLTSVLVAGLALAGARTTWSGPAAGS